MPSDTPNATYVRAMLRLTLTPGLGPILIGRALQTLGSPEEVLSASPANLQRVEGIGDGRARQIAAGFGASEARADEEFMLAESLGVHLIAIGTPDYPPLLKQIPDPPPILYVRGTLKPATVDRYCVAIVGSRSCTHYAIEQSERFAQTLAQSGLTVISGGARGVDTAAHRAALRVNGRTIAVLGCGLAECYPPDNRELFDRIAGEEGRHGAVVSELPLRSPPNAENFPARNRIISGLSLGTLVVEAGLKSGALITARVAAEDHGREVFALPARVDSSHAQGSLNLLKSGGAHLVTHPDDIIQQLESPARHAFQGTHEARYGLFEQPVTHAPVIEASPHKAPPPPLPSTLGLSDLHVKILDALDKPRTIDQLSAALSTDAAKLRAEITMLELKRKVVRRGSMLERQS